MKEPIEYNNASFDQTDGGKTKSNAIDVPSISLPKGGGAIKGIDEKFSVNAVNGTASFSVPLPFSPSRGFSPSLSLSYNSGSGNGVFGLGWKLDLASVRRKTEKSLPQYLDPIDSDTFLLSDAEDLVPEFKKEDDGNFSLTSDGDYIMNEKDSEDHSYRIRFYKPRIEGLFARIERWTEKTTGLIKWRAITRDNVTTLFGWSDNSVISDPDESSKIFEWLPEFMFDDKGNCSHYIYKKEDNKGCDPSLLHNRNRLVNGTITYTNLYPEKILYGNKTPFKKFGDAFPAETDYLFRTVFDYGEYDKIAPYGMIKDWDFRPDAFSDHRGGFEIRTTRLCNRILFYHHFTGPNEYDGLVRSVNFEYDTSSEKDFTFLKSITAHGYIKKADGTYASKKLPASEFEYQKHEWNSDIKTISAENLVHAPAGLDGQRYLFTDLFNEGLSGILTEQATGWYYKHNLGNGEFEQAKLITPKPSFSGLGGPLQLADLDADGGKQLVSFSAEPKGFFELDDDKEWKPFVNFNHLPNINFSDANTRMLDLNGDGKPEVLITEDNIFTWYPSEGRNGYSQAYSTVKSFDEETGPHIVFADRKQTVFLADMSGDGLTDIVRIRNGEVCYWPNLGYGKFGTKVAMDHSPWFDHPDSFNPAFIRLADIDGSGTTDIIYLGKNKFSCWMNMSGNAFSTSPFETDAFPPVDNQSQITVTDFLGTGLTCIVWSSSLDNNSHSSLRYIDLMNGKKPHVLAFYKNNLGKEVTIEYTPSTQFYIEDKKAGNPWITRLHFPVHCISKTITEDKIAGFRFVSEYRYHHGYYDHAEREFRGFGMVEQTDSEIYEDWVKENAGNIVDRELHQDPVLTKSWFHTGAFLRKDKILHQFAHEYWYEEMTRHGFPVISNEASLPDARLIAAPGTGPSIIDQLTPEEWNETLRACKSLKLRSEVFAQDAPLAGASVDDIKKQLTPYSVAAFNYVIELLQPKGKNKHGIYIVKESESITYNYERNPEDPRIAHRLNVKVDEYGHVLESASVVYPRLLPDPALPPETQQAQSNPVIIYTKNKFTNDVTGNDIYRLRLPSETETYELKGVARTGTFYQISDFDDILSNVRSSTAEYHELDKPLIIGIAQKRLIEHVRSTYYSDDLNGALPLHRLGSLAVPFESYQLAYTLALLEEIFGPCNLPDSKIDDSLMLEGKFTHSRGENDTEDANWWIRSGTTLYLSGSESVTDSQNRFYVPISYTDPFGSVTKVKYYGGYYLFIQETEDALHNRTIVDLFNFRTLSPQRMRDMNNNVSEVIADELGIVKAMAVSGKGTQADDLAGMEETTENEQASIDAFFTTANAAGICHSDELQNTARLLLKHATTRFIYDLEAYSKTGKPAAAGSVSRETHYRKEDGSLNATGKIQLAFEYTGGLGNVIMKKVQAKPGQAFASDGAGNKTPFDTTPFLRWIGSGRTIVNNKGNPVKQYEPYFSVTPGFDNEKELVECGVTPVMYYDAMGRCVKIRRPDATLSRVEFDAWKKISYDANDTILEPECTWFINRTNHLTDAELMAAGKDPDREKMAADKAATHADTPHRVHFDALGRPVLSVEHNKEVVTGASESYQTKIRLDAEGNLRTVTDARELPENASLGNTVMHYKYDMLGNKVYQKSMDTGQRWLLLNILGSPLRTWDERGHEFQYLYDALHRPVQSIVKGGDGTVSLNNVFDRIIYGESGINAESKNLRGKIIEHYDTGGVILTPEFDFKGQPKFTTRKLFKNYKTVADWIDANLAADLEADEFTITSETDALGRIIKQTAPDGSIITPAYNEAGLLEAETVLHPGDAMPRSYIKNIDYNEKGQRYKIIYGNDVTTRFRYDSETFRLVHLESRRGNGQIVQDLYYTYDPVGNIIFIKDEAIPVSFFANSMIEPLSEYTYDALYRLVQATGRENNAALNYADCDNWNDTSFLVRINQGDPMAVRNYTQSYQYDQVGNILEMKHKASGGDWTRRYEYETLNNRLRSTHIGDNGNPADYTKYSHHAKHGYITELPHLEKISWNFKEEVILTSRQHCTDDNIPVNTYYQYDGNGQRIHKITENGTQAGGTPAKKEECIYVFGYEVYKKHTGTHAGLQRATLSLLDEGHRFVMVETRNDVDDGTEKQLVRYQLHNHLGSAALELDGTPQANVISYEEYHPFGTTAYQAVNKAIKAAAKRYRFTGMERDEESGLEYHSARYYLSWLARWLSADPLGITDGVNVYRYCKNSPVMKVDASGNQGDEPFFRPISLSLLDPRTTEDIVRERIASSLSPGTLRIDPLLDAAPVSTLLLYSLAGTSSPSGSSSGPTSGEAAPSAPETPEEPSSPFPISASFQLFSPRLDIRFWERALLTADTSTVSLSTINTGDFAARVQYTYGGEISVRLGNPDIGAGSVAYDPSSEVATFTASGGSGDSATGFRGSFSATTAGNLSLSTSFGVSSPFGEPGAVRFTSTYGYNAATSAFSFSFGFGGQLLPFADDLSRSVYLGESRGRDVLSDIGNISLSSWESITGYVERHTAERPIDAGNPAGGTVSDFSAIGNTVETLTGIGSIPSHPDVRGGLQFSIGPSAVNQDLLDIRFMLGLQMFGF